MLWWLQNITPEILTSTLRCLADTCLLSCSWEREPKGPPVPTDPHGWAGGGRLFYNPPLLPPMSADQETSWDPPGFPFLIHRVFVTKGPSQF